jgi:hypothetical protein
MMEASCHCHEIILKAREREEIDEECHLEWVRAKADEQERCECQGPSSFKMRHYMTRTTPLSELKTFLYSWLR